MNTPGWWNLSLLQRWHEEPGVVCVFLAVRVRLYVPLRLVLSWHFACILLAIILSLWLCVFILFLCCFLYESCGFVFAIFGHFCVCFAGSVIAFACALMVSFEVGFFWYYDVSSLAIVSARSCCVFCVVFVFVLCFSVCRFCLIYVCVFLRSLITLACALLVGFRRTFSWHYYASGFIA